MYSRATVSCVIIHVITKGSWFILTDDNISRELSSNVNQYSLNKDTILQHNLNGRRQGVEAPCSTEAVLASAGPSLASFRLQVNLPSPHHQVIPIEEMRI